MFFINLILLSTILNIEVIKLINFKNSFAKLITPVLTFLLSVFSYRLVMIWVNQVSGVEPLIFQGTIIVTTILASLANYFSIFVFVLIYFMIKYMLPGKSSEILNFSTIGRIFGCLIPIILSLLFNFSGGFILKPIITFSIVNLDMREYAHECSNLFLSEKIRVLGDNKILVYTPNLLYPNIQDPFRVDVCK